MEQIPILIIMVPFFAAFVVSLVGLKRVSLCQPITLLALTFSLTAAILNLMTVIANGGAPVTYRLGGWAPPIGIEYRIDPLNSAVLVLITVVALLTAIYSRHAVPRENARKEAHFYSLYLLLVVGLLGMTITGDAFNLYVFLEISSLTSYALIAMGTGRAALSCFNYIIMGTIGASLYLLGVGYLYIQTGSLNMMDIARIIVEQDLGRSSTIVIGAFLILLGLWIKMALFPMHRWLPDAYSYAPTTTTCLIAPLMTKVSIYVMIRFMYTVFGMGVYLAGWRENLVICLAVAAMIVGSFYALARVKLRKMLSYLIVAEVGYMVGGAFLANEAGLTGAIYHILSDSLMTLCLFMAASIIIFKRKTTHINGIKGMFRQMPITMAAFTVGALSMIGIPPTCGFFSKWYLITGGIKGGHWFFVSGLLISSLVNAILFFRLLEKALFDDPIGHDVDENYEGPSEINEAPVSMLFPLLVSAVLIILLGLYAGDVSSFLIKFSHGV